MCLAKCVYENVSCQPACDSFNSTIETLSRYEHHIRSTYLGHRTCEQGRERSCGNTRSPSYSSSLSKKRMICARLTIHNMSSGWACRGHFKRIPTGKETPKYNKSNTRACEDLLDRAYRYLAEQKRKKTTFLPCQSW